MKIAVPVWEGKVSPVFDTASRLVVVETNPSTAGSRVEVVMGGKDLSGRCRSIKALDVEVLICGAVSRPLVLMMEAAGIRVISGISGLAEEVLSAYIAGTLFKSEFLLPGYSFDSEEKKRS